MAQRTRRVEISLRPARSRKDTVELSDADLLPVEEPAARAFGLPACADESLDEEQTYCSDDSMDVDLGELATDEAPRSSQRTAGERARLGKETLIMLAPIMVKQLARPTAPPPRFPRSAGLLMAAAAVCTVLLSASVALAWT